MWLFQPARTLALPVNLQPKLDPNRVLSPVSARARSGRPPVAREEPVWRKHPYASLECVLACGRPPAWPGAPEHTCVYVRDPAQAPMGLRLHERPQNRCWHQ
jgi:hypothetical protein